MTSGSSRHTSECETTNRADAIATFVGVSVSSTVRTHEVDLGDRETSMVVPAIDGSLADTSA